MTEKGMLEFEEFWRKKRTAKNKVIFGVLLFVILTIVMFYSFTGTNFGLFSSLLEAPIPLGCVVLFLLVHWLTTQFSRMLKWPSPKGD